MVRWSLAKCQVSWRILKCCLSCENWLMTHIFRSYCILDRKGFCRSECLLKSSIKWCTDVNLSHPCFLAISPQIENSRGLNIGSNVFPSISISCNGYWCKEVSPIYCCHGYCPALPYVMFWRCNYVFLCSLSHSSWNNLTWKSSFFCNLLLLLWSSSVHICLNQ